MLSLEEALLLKAAYEEKEKQDAMSIAGVSGGVAGGALGLAAGAVPHAVGKGVNALTGRSARAFRPGFRLAGGLTGAILGGALGAGTAALMKQNNRPAQILGEIQARGGKLDPATESELADLLGELYSQQARQ